MYLYLLHAFFSYSRSVSARWDSTNYVFKSRYKNSFFNFSHLVNVFNVFSSLFLQRHFASMNFAAVPSSPQRARATRCSYIADGRTDGATWWIEETRDPGAARKMTDDERRRRRRGIVETRRRQRRRRLEMAGGRGLTTVNELNDVYRLYTPLQGRALPPGRPRLRRLQCMDDIERCAGWRTDSPADCGSATCIVMPPPLQKLGHGTNRQTDV